jgi:N-acetylneuraminate 9-O-acetyltransferase
MQLVILVYHMTGASGILPIYMHIRVMVSSYLFLSGYGHFCYFWHRGEAGLVRFLQVTNQITFILKKIINLFDSSCPFLAFGLNPDICIY